MAREPATGPQERGTSPNEKSLLKRRDYLRLSATATAVGAVSGAVLPGSVAATSSSEHSFDRVVDAVDDLGMDPTGEEAIDDILSDEIPADTLIEFPAGEYLVTDSIKTDGVERFGIGVSDATSGDVRFVVSARDAQQSSERPASSTLLVYREDSFELHDVDPTALDADTATDSETPRTLTIVGPDDGVANYRLTVAGSVDSHSDDGTQQSNGLPSTSVEDALDDTTHRYVYTGEIGAFRLDGDATVYVDGQQVDPDALGVHQSQPSRLPRLLVFDARDDQTDYELRLHDSDNDVLDVDDSVDSHVSKQ
jgi:hypothetical protein